MAGNAPEVTLPRDTPLPPLLQLPLEQVIIGGGEAAVREMVGKPERAAQSGGSPANTGASGWAALI